MADKKHLIPVIRKTIPSDLAKSIVGVQPMTGNMGEIFNLGKVEKTKWSEWETRFTWLPKKSIYGKIIWGSVQHRHEMNAWDKVPLASGVKQWATKKEVFKSKLRGDRELIEVTTPGEYYKRTTANG